MAAVSYGPRGHLALLVDQATQHKFLVDTGSAFSIIPYKSTDVPTGPCICAADRTPIACWGTVERTIRAVGCTFKWTFLRAAVAFPILGVDWLHHFRLLVDHYGMRLWPRGGGRGLHLETPGSGQQYAAVGVVAMDNICAYPGDCEFPGSPGAQTRTSSKHVAPVGDGESISLHQNVLSSTC